MNNREVMEQMKLKLSAYLQGLNEFDEETLNNVLKKYSQKLDELLDYYGIKNVDVDYLMDEIKSESKFVQKHYDRSDDRANDEQMLRRDFDTKAEQLDYKNDKRQVLMGAFKNFEMAIEDEIKYSSMRMENCMEEVLNTALEMTKQELVRNGYYNIDDLNYELNQTARSLHTYFIDEYADTIKYSGRSKVNEVMDDINSVKQENTLDAISNLNITPKEIFDDYKNGKISDGIKLLSDELDIDVMTISEPKFENDRNSATQKGLYISKSILDEAIEDENENIFEKDFDEFKYSVVEMESYVMILTSKENDQIQDLNRKKQKEIEAEKAKAKAKPEKEAEHYEFL